MEWNKIKEQANRELQFKNISPFVSVSSLLCVLVTKDQLYFGKDIYLDKKLVATAEEQAFYSLTQNLKSNIDYIVLFNEIGEVMKPSVDLLYKVLALDIKNNKTKVLLPSNIETTVNDLLPDWWGTCRLKK